MSLVCTIAAFCILIAGLFAVIVERTNERDAARDELARRDREGTATVPVPLMRPGKGTRLYAVPEQREPAHDHLAADDEWFARLYDDKGDLR